MKDKPKAKRVSKKIRKGDRVLAIAGNYKGMSGTVMSCDGEKIIVQGLNVRKRHMKGNGQNQKGQIVQLEKPIHISNLKLCLEDQTPIKLHVRTTEAGDRELVYTADSKEVVHRAIKKS